MISFYDFTGSPLQACFHKLLDSQPCTSSLSLWHIYFLNVFTLKDAIMFSYSIVTALGMQEDQTMPVIINTLRNDSDQDRTCSEGFYIDESTGLCIPECGVWEEFPHSFVVGVDAVVILSAIVYLLSGVAVLVLSCINYKRM